MGSLDLAGLLGLLGPVGAAFGVYAGIRADLARLHDRTERAQKVAERAHDRIDGLIRPASAT